MLAVENYGFALRDVSEDLQNNFEIVQAAVFNDGHSLKYASAQMRDNDEIVLIAYAYDPDTL